MAVARRARFSKAGLEASRLAVVVEVSVNSRLDEYDNIAKTAGGVGPDTGWEREFMRPSSQNVLK